MTTGQMVVGQSAAPYSLGQIALSETFEVVATLSSEGGDLKGENVNLLMARGECNVRMGGGEITKFHCT